VHNPQKDGFFGVDSEGVTAYVTPLVGADYRRKQWKKVDIRQAAREVRERLQPKKRADALMEAWLRFLFWKAGKASAETGIAVTAGWAATRLNPERYGVLREGLRQEHQTWTPSVEEALLTELLERVSELDESVLADPNFAQMPFELAKAIQSELRRSQKQVLESDRQPLGDEDAWVIEDALASKEPGPEEQLMNRESKLNDFVEAAGLGPQEKELMQAFLNNPDLIGYGGNKELADSLNWSIQQVGVVKKRALDKMRRIRGNAA